MDMARSWRWARALRLAVDCIWWLSVAAVAAATVLLALVATHAVGGAALTLDAYFRLPAHAYHVSAGQLSGSPAKLANSAGQLAFGRPRLGFVLVSAAVLAVAAAAWLFIVYQLRGLFRTLAAGEPFARGNQSRLRRVGLAVIASELGHALAVWGGGLYLEHAVVTRGLALRSHFGIDVPVVVLGVVFLALAAAFRVGFQLAREQALTV